MRRITLLIAAMLLAMSVMATPAVAWHEHTLHTPGATVTFKCEREAAAAKHPIHFGLHVGLRDRGRSLDNSETDPVYMMATGSLGAPVCPHW